MLIQLTGNSEWIIRSLVDEGRFASENDVIDEALRLLKQNVHQDPAPPKASSTSKPFWEMILEIAAEVPDEIWKTVPTDLAERHDEWGRSSPGRSNP